VGGYLLDLCGCWIDILADLCDCGSGPRVSLSTAVGLYLTMQRLIVSHDSHFALLTSYWTIRCRNAEESE
jgi:hypothetical protein